MPPRRKRAPRLDLAIPAGAVVDNDIGRKWDEILNPHKFRCNAAYHIADALKSKGQESSGIGGTLLTAADRKRLAKLPRMAFDWTPETATPLHAMKEAYLVTKDGTLIRHTAKRHRLKLQPRPLQHVEVGLVSLK